MEKLIYPLVITNNMFDENLTKAIEEEYSKLMRPNHAERLWYNSLHKPLWSRYQLNIQSVPKLTELREEREYRELGEVVQTVIDQQRSLRMKRCSMLSTVAAKVAKAYGYPPEDVRALMLYETALDIPRLAIPETPPKAGSPPELQLVVVALGEPSSNYPHLQFREKHTLMGWYSIVFNEVTEGLRSYSGVLWRIPSEFAYLNMMPMFSSYLHPPKMGVRVRDDVIYIPPEFRRMGIDIAKQLVESMESILTTHNYGNIEVRMQTPSRMNLLNAMGYTADPTCIGSFWVMGKRL